MADIESQVRGDGEAFTRADRPPSYTRLCTYKILPICLAICIISIFAAAIVCTSLNKPIPSDAVIVISVLAGCLLLLIFAGCLKIYHDQNGMGKVHPRAEQALKGFRDRLVRLFCCIDMASYAPSSNNTSNHEEAEKNPRKEEDNVGEEAVQPVIRLASRSPRREPLQRPGNAVQGPRDQPQTPGNYPPRHQVSRSNLQQDRRPQGLRPPEPRHPAPSHQSPLPRFEPQSAASSNYRGASQANEMLYSEVVPIDGRYSRTLPVTNSRDTLSSERRPSAAVPPLQTPQSRPRPNNQAIHLTSVPDAAAQLQAVLGDTPTTPLQSFLKPTRSIRYEQDTDHRRFESPPNSPTQDGLQSASGTSTNASSSLASRPGSNISSPSTPTTRESANLPQFLAQCHTEQLILRNNRDLLVEHRAQYHTRHSAGLTYCRPIRTTQGQWIKESEE
ncbi:hypothetical protein PG994_009131 [Apiospora phragmitis]|uniref:Uncharacterized protein n=1 Tax=Apiospora phragmitis TaxID=2905665 RepID=A0ABR1UL98_9PEZI